MIYIAALWQAYERRKITHIGWVASVHNIPGAMTNPGNCVALESFLATGHLSLEVAQSVVHSVKEAVQSEESPPVDEGNGIGRDGLFSPGHLRNVPSKANPATPSTGANPFSPATTLPPPPSRKQPQEQP